MFNLVSVMENNLGDYLMLMENDILKVKDFNYKKVILTPLIMDFGNKGKTDFPNIYYHRLSTKPVVDQVIDLLYGIKDYMKKSDNHLLEIYPFLGINIQNYNLKDESKIRLQDKIELKNFLKIKLNVLKMRQEKNFEIFRQNENF